MPPTRDEVTQNLAERLCWEVARRDDSRVARRLYHTQGVDGVYRLDEGAWLEEFFHVLQARGVMTWLEEVQGTSMPRVLVPFVHDRVLYGRKTLWGGQRMKALPTRWCSAEAVMRLVGFNAQQVREGICQRGRTKRQGKRSPGPICPDTLANNLVTWHWRDLEARVHGVIRAWATVGVVGKRVTAMADGPDVETPERDTGCGQATRQRRIEDNRGQGHASEVTVYGGNGLRWIDAVTKMPLAVKVGQMQAHETLWTRALVTQARTHLAGSARLHKIGFDRGVWAGTDRWWLDQPGLRCVGPAKDTMAVTAEARALAAVGQGVTVGRRLHTVRHGQGQAAWTARLEPAVGGGTGLLTYEP